MSTQVKALASLRSRTTGAVAQARTIVPSRRIVPTLYRLLAGLPRRALLLAGVSGVLCIATPAVSNAADPNGDGIPGPPELPDRNYEMVSPTDKNGINVTPDVTIIDGPRSRANGEGLFYSARGSFAGNPSSPFTNSYLSSRSQDKWSTNGGDPSLAPIASNRPRIAQLSTDLKKAVVFSNRALGSDGWASPNGFALGEAIYVRDYTDDSYQLVTPPPAPGGAGGLLGGTPYRSDVAGADGDLSNVLFTTTAELTAAAVPLPDFETKVYKWSNGSVTLESVLPDGSPATGSAGAARPDFLELMNNMISTDGSRVFFTSPATGSDPAPLYVRENGVTTLIDPNATFYGATPDGDRAFYTTDGKVISYEVPTGSVTEISVDEEPADGSSPSALGIVGFSDDGARVYFAASSQLVSGAPTDGGPKLYVWDEDHVKFIASVGPETDPSIWDTIKTTKEERLYIPPTGAALLFGSQDSLTGYDNSNPECEDDGLCMELFLYRVGEPGLVCISCNLSGAPPTGDVKNFTGPLPRGGRSVSDSGDRAFFASPDPLVPRDVNGSTDVYMWEDGTVALISSGRHEEPSALADSSPQGDDVFFTTAERLVGWDRDNAQDMYDARVGGGFPEPPKSAPLCNGDACQGREADPPAVRGANSSSFRGSGTRTVGKERDCATQAKRFARAKDKVKRLKRQLLKASAGRIKSTRKRLRKSREVRRQLRKKLRRCEAARPNGS